MRNLASTMMVALLLLGCEDPAGTDAGPGGADAGPGGADAGPGGSDAGPAGADSGPGGADAGPGSSDAGPAGACLPTGNACPSHTVTGDDITCMLDHTGATNLVEDSRLEFGMGPDHAILFTAPSAGEYAIELTAEPSTNGGCGVTAADAASMFHEVSDCPASGMTVDLDGFFSSGAAFPHSFTAGQQVLLFVGCAYWSDAQAGPYTLRIQRL